MRREGNVPAGRAVRPGQAGPPWYPPAPVPAAPVPVPVPVGTAKRRGERAAPRVWVGGDWVRRLLVSLIFSRRGELEVGEGLCSHPASYHHPGKGNPGLTPIPPWIFHAAPAPRLVGVRGHSTPLKSGLSPAPTAEGPAPRLLHRLSRWPCIFLLK